MVRELISRIIDEEFIYDPPMVLGTGGFAQLFSPGKFFDHVVPDLILEGLKEIVRLNR